MIKNICQKINDIIDKKYDIDLYALEYELLQLRLLVTEEQEQIVVFKNNLERQKNDKYIELKPIIKTESGIENQIKIDLQNQISEIKELESIHKSHNDTIYAYIRFADAIRDERILQATNKKLERELAQ